ncbi:MAG: malonyl-CoA synthase [SAR324 cluster bacterium]|nr:malonyl-CoA synthase [SAR324 cluster bacterium]
MTNPLYYSFFERHRDSDALLMILENGSRLSYRAFLETASRFANALVEIGVQPGDRVVLQVPKSAEALAIYAACIQSGSVMVPLNTGYTPAEVDYFVGDAQPKLVICDPKRQEGLQSICENHGAQLETLDAIGGGSFAEHSAKLPKNFQTIERSIDDLAAFLYTSGTTGRSKGAMLTQGNLLSNAEALVQTWCFTSSDVLFHALPIFHTHGLFVASNVTFLAGSSMIFLSSFKAQQAIEHLPKATTMMGVPTFYTRLLDEPRLNRELVQHMRLFISGSAPLLTETHLAFEERTGHRILERYGMTETNMITSNPYETERRAGTVGHPLPGVEVRITEPETATPTPAGEIGMIEVRGPNVFIGYWKMPEKTAEEFREDGFFLTGDLGQLDEVGYVQIVGRSRDLIISGGYNIYPKEIELLLDEQEGVLESTVIGVPHPDFGEGVVGVLVPQAGCTLDVEQIVETLKPMIARFKQPKQLFVLPELPRNTMGKVQKNILREQYAQVFLT